MLSKEKQPFILLFILLTIVYLFGCGDDRGVTPNGETDFWRKTNGPGGGRTFSLAISPGGHIFAGTYGGGVFRSQDNGDNWTQVNTGLTNAYVRALAINSGGDIFAGTEGGGVFRSQDNGDNWTEVNTGLTYTGVEALAINSGGGIFAGTYGGGVFCSSESTD